MLISVITCFLMTQYFLDYIFANFYQKAIVFIERKIDNKIDYIKQKPNTKRIIKEFNKLKDRVS